MVSAREYEAGAGRPPWDKLLRCTQRGAELCYQAVAGFRHSVAVPKSYLSTAMRRRCRAPGISRTAEYSLQPPAFRRISGRSPCGSMTIQPRPTASISTGLVQFRDRIEAVALKIAGMVEQAHLRILSTRSDRDARTASAGRRPELNRCRRPRGDQRRLGHSALGWRRNYDPGAGEPRRLGAGREPRP